MITALLVLTSINTAAIVVGVFAMAGSLGRISFDLVTFEHARGEADIKAWDRHTTLRKDLGLSPYTDLCPNCVTAAPQHAHWCPKAVSE